MCARHGLLSRVQMMSYTFVCSKLNFNYLFPYIWVSSNGTLPLYLNSICLFIPLTKSDISYQIYSANCLHMLLFISCFSPCACLGHLQKKKMDWKYKDLGEWNVILKKSAAVMRWEWENISKQYCQFQSYFYSHKLHSPWLQFLEEPYIL